VFIRSDNRVNMSLVVLHVVGLWGGLRGRGSWSVGHVAGGRFLVI
jgi:hypothetical protein